MGEQSPDPVVADQQRTAAGSPASAPTNDDQTLMQQVQRGDHAAFAALVERHKKSVFAYLRARVLQNSDAEDMTQEVFLRCYQARMRFDSGNLVRPFLLGIARNVLREHARAHARRKEILWTEICLELERVQPQDERTYDDVLVHLPDCLRGLNEAARRAIEMHYRGQTGHVAIARALGRSAGAVKLLLFRARRSLRRCLDARRRHDHA